MTVASLYQFLSAHHHAVISSVAENNEPQAALVGVAITENLELIFDTTSDTRKYDNLVRNPALAAVIGWDGEQTVQYEGIARLLTGDELKPYQEIYLRAFPDGIGRAAWEHIAYFVVQPKWIRFSDFNHPSPLIVEFNF